MIRSLPPSRRRVSSAIQ
jgi:ABC-type transporter Mla subunit MlaD